MSWEAVSGISGVISAIAAIVGGINLSIARRRGPESSLISVPLSYFFLFCFGWVLSVIAYNWFFQPFGDYLFPSEEKKLYGAMLGVPALIIALYAVKKLLLKR